jgi:hypothetical protein
LDIVRDLLNVLAIGLLDENVASFAPVATFIYKLLDI